MTCDLCGEKEATVHLTEIIEGETRELHLCESCARERGQGMAKAFGLSDLLGGLADFGAKMEEEEKPALTCPRCGMSYEDFRKTGRLGCGSCYEAFHKYLSPLLRRIHGSTHHVGKSVPAPGAKAVEEKEDLKRLREKLAQAIQKEDFEEAARLRDRIRAMEARSKRAR